VKRLAEHQLVWLCAAHRDGPARQCTVVTVYRDTAVLAPLGKTTSMGDRNGVPSEWFLVFDHDEQPVALRGTVEQNEDDLRFSVTDGVRVSQDAAPLVARELPIELVATDRGYAEPVQATTSIYSADGAVLKDAGDLVEGESVQFTFSPREGLNVSGRGRVLSIDGKFGVLFSGLDRTLRDRMVEDVISAKRRAIAAK
jgi:hypothetical protein